MDEDGCQPQRDDHCPCYHGSRAAEEESVATEPTAQVGTRVLFENERVRVWDLALAPGESLAKHIHRNDYFFIVVSA